MRIFLTILIVFYAFPALACEGFDNAMGALENTLKTAQSQENPKQSLPHMQSIHQDLDALEKAVREHDERRVPENHPPAKTL